MLVSIFLAKVIGLYFVIVSLMLLINPSRFRDFSLDFFKNETQLMVTGLFILILGILMVVSHNVWTLDWRILITLISWIVLIKGVLLALNPSWLSNTFRLVYKNSHLRLFAIFYLAVGLFFCWEGFA